MRTSPPQPQPVDAASTAEAAELRLREAEQRLKEAIEDLQRRQRGEPANLHPPCDHADESCVANAVGNLCQSFLLSYGIRVGIGILLRAFKLARLKSYSSLLDIKKSGVSLSSKLTKSRKEARKMISMQMGLISQEKGNENITFSSKLLMPTCFREGSYSKRGSLSNWFTFWGIHRFLPCFEVFAEKVEKEGDSNKCVIKSLSYLHVVSVNSTWVILAVFRILAGAISGLSILALDDSSRRRTLALYLFARLAQCAYNSAKSKNKFHLWGSHWSHGDTLLFSIACAQIMYAFVMRPESLPKSYRDFIQKTGPVAEPVYKAVRDCCRGSPVDVDSLSAYLSSRRAPKTLKLEEFPRIIPCSIIHPDTNSCLVHNGNVATSTFRKTFPLYFSLTFVPFVVLRLQKFMDAPVRTCWHAVTGAVRSTTFLSAFVGIFQGVICLHRKVALRDHKLVYWLAGGISALSVLLEKKARRGELALYVLPRAGESLWYILVNRRLLPDIKNAEVALFCACMGGIMYYLEHEPDTMAPFLRGLIRRFLASRISNPGPPSSRNASYTYLHTLDAMKKPDVQDSREVETLPPRKYNLESIPGL
ncbi:mitochondrial import inner membrane translocase [Striga asiatica]|uniref:Mitochondrial import inner membrane translocase n=1 Tax=Striga asiatica TaxID=4170 RepID=A0A5A7R0H0_STRAF|nr:mitochondrial import inner membrane translocase [Striga asiatica]